MFTEQEIALMREAGIKLDFSRTEKFSDDDWIEIGDVVGEWVQLHRFCEDYDLNPTGIMCLDILEKLARMD